MNFGFIEKALILIALKFDFYILMINIFIHIYYSPIEYVYHTLWQSVDWVSEMTIKIVRTPNLSMEKFCFICVSFINNCHEILRHPSKLWKNNKMYEKKFFFNNAFSVWIESYEKRKHLMLVSLYWLVDSYILFIA